VNQPNVVCKLSEINDGELIEVKVGETPVLLARVEGKCYALAAHCTHYGAPLADGYLSGDRIVCPWHHACFNARSGALEEPPALDSLASYPIRLEADNIIVELPEDAPDRRTPDMTTPEPDSDRRKFVIIGGGAAGYTAAQTLREDGFAGRIVMITPEVHLPYDRPNLSKDYLQGQAEPEWMPLRPDDFYSEHGIEIVRDEVKSVTRGEKQILFNSGQKLDFDSLLIATGGVPRRLDLSGSELENIFVLRSFASADAIISAAESVQNIVVIGASFIAMEAASSLTKRGKHVTVIAPDTVPFERTLGPEIGKLFQDLHEKNGVSFRLGSGVTGFSGDKRVEKVLLSTGDPVEAELVIVGIGVRPATEFLNGFDLHKDGGAISDGSLRLADDVFAAGDIVHYPDARTGELYRIKHWRTAMQLGRVAAHNMAGKATIFDGVPFFWTTQFDATLNYVGHAAGWDRTVIQGDLESHDFLVFYIKDGAIKAVAGMDRDRELDVWEERFRLGGVPSPAELEKELSAKATT
jgi:NADPH-dependent 2,4-dienoyl-CoA reductase/sulfur reductase-like enzyme/nitrite reductase/ring-hydroxylating ferredoxin subunit